MASVSRSRAPGHALCVCVLAAAFLAPPLHAAPPDLKRIRAAVNDLRTKGCGQRPAVPSRLEAVAGLDEIAEDMARGLPLRQAVEGKAYRITRSASVRMSRPRNEAALQRMLRNDFCSEVTDPEFRDMGVAGNPKLVWIVLATPFEPPSVADTATISARMLKLVNEARSTARRCGSESMPPAPPLKLEARLSQAALGHSRDMAGRGSMSHAGTDGSTPAVRATRAGYAWRNVAENVAAGQTTPDAALQSWLDSPGHCVNLMGASYSDMGIAFFVDRDSTEGIYWTQMLGRPK